jgi:hypothetical protein
MTLIKTVVSKVRDDESLCPEYKDDDDEVQNFNHTRPAFNMAIAVSA